MIDFTTQICGFPPKAQKNYNYHQCCKWGQGQNSAIVSNQPLISIFMDKSTQNHDSRYRTVEFLKGDQAFLQVKVCCSILHLNPRSSLHFGTNNGRIFSVSRATRIDLLHTLTFPGFHQSMQGVSDCPFINDGLKDTAQTSLFKAGFISLCVSFTFYEELNLFWRIISMQILRVSGCGSTLGKVE